MGSSEEKPKYVGVDRAPSGNPYGAVDDIDDPLEESLYVTRSADVQDKGAAHPYARIGAEGEDEPRPVKGQSIGKLVVPENGKRNKLSKKDFIANSQIVLRQYVPTHGSRQLPEHLRDFIARNAARSPEERFQVWQELSRYDLRDLGPTAMPQFNRERELLTKEKLQEIEDRALGKG